MKKKPFIIRWRYRVACWINTLDQKIRGRRGRWCWAALCGWSFRSDHKKPDCPLLDPFHGQNRDYGSKRCIKDMNKVGCCWCGKFYKAKNDK